MPPHSSPNLRPAAVLAIAAVGLMICGAALFLQIVQLLDPCPALFAKPNLAQPMLPAIVCFGALLAAANPLPLLHRDARARVAKTMKKLVCVPLSLRAPVQFEDFFLG